MANDASPRNDRARTRWLAAELARCRAAAWVIDPAGARVLAANEEGRALLALPEPPSMLPPDAAMPSLARLREIAHEPVSEAAYRETLRFPTPEGEVRLRCDVRRLSGSATASLLLVCAVPADEQAAEDETQGSNIPRAEGQSAQDDAATLRAIARQIRAGLSKSGAERSEAASPGGPQAEPVWKPDHIARLAHELRTPLSAIAAAAEIMKDEHLGPLGDARYAGYASDILASARHALAVIGSMLGDGAGEAALPRLTFAELDANLIAESALSPMLPLADRAGLRLRLELMPRLPHVVADATSVKQILLNLLTNAVKFTAKGGEVCLRTSYALDGPVKVSVCDTGRGMTDREIREALRRDMPLREVAARTSGIGLPLVRALAAANGAELSIESAPGRGTTATVTFPRDRVIPV